MSTMVKVQDLSWRYPSFGDTDDNPWSLKGINLEINRGEFFGIAGPSGAGKTTTCKAITGIIPHGRKIPLGLVNHHIQGSVSVDGEVVTQANPDAGVVEGEPLGKITGKGIVSPKVGMVLQDPETQFLKMSVLHEVSFGLQLTEFPNEEIEARVHEALRMVGLDFLIPDAMYIHPNDLSGGQKQRVAIASFLALRPELLILDEPTSDLDPRGKREVIETVGMLRERHDMTIILVEQDPDILCRFCDRIALIDDGKVCLVEEPCNFYRKVDVLDDCGVYKFEVSQVAHRTGISFDGGVPISLEESLSCFPEDLDLSLQPDDPEPSGKSLIEVKDLEYVYEDGTKALHDVSFDLYEGEVLALLGTNGSGKTTVAKILNGIYKPSGGSVLVLGQDVGRRPVRQKLPRHVGYVFQNPDHQIFTRKAWDEVEYGLKNLGLPEDEIEERIASSLEAVGLSDKAEEDPLFLGKGQRQRLAVASILAMEPEIIIVDEPTTGQDYRMVCGIMDLLERLHKRGNTVLIITHDMTLVASYCTRVVVLLNGRTVFTGTPRELFASEENIQLTQLRAPQAISLSAAMRDRCGDYPVLLNAREWISAIHARGEARPKVTE